MSEPTWTASDASVLVACAVCKAEPGEWCRTQERGTRDADELHRKRVDTAIRMFRAAHGI